MSAISTTSATAARPVAPRRRVVVVALWVAQVALALVFLLAGGAKLAGAPPMVAAFDAFGAATGVGPWFRHVTALLEIGGAALLLVPGFAAFGAVDLAGVMVGAVFTHLFVMHTSPAVPAALLLLLAAVAYGRRAQLTRVAT